MKEQKNSTNLMNKLVYGLKVLVLYFKHLLNKDTK